MPVIKEKKETTKTKVQKITVANTEITIGNIYEVLPKKDLSAPAPKNGIPTVKNQTPGTGEVRGIVWDEATRRWDTGFEINSPCNASIRAENREAMVDIYKTYIQKPYEEYYQVDTSAVNNDFWGGNDDKEIDPYTYSLDINRSFDTSKPEDLFDLFIALKQGRLCEVGERDATLQRHATYCIRNREKQMSFQEERFKNKAKAMHTFMNMLDALDPKGDDTLYTILEWMNLSNIRGAESEVLERQVLKMFENDKTGYDSVERFIEAYDMTKSETGKQEMELFSILSKLNIKHKIEYKRKQYYLDDVLIGNTLKAAAKTALSNVEIKELIISHYEKIQ